MRAVVRANGLTSNQQLFAKIIERVRSGHAFSEWVLEEARLQSPIKEPDSLQPEMFEQVLGLLVQDEDILIKALKCMPEEAAPTIETALRYIRSEFIPRNRDNARILSKELRGPPAGGRPKSPITDENKAKICREIEKLRSQGVAIGIAQQRMADKYNLKLRTVQEIWQKRPR